MKISLLLSLMVAFLGINTIYGQTTNFTFVNKSVTIDAEVPNYGRGAQFWNGTPWNNVDAPQVPNGTVNGKTFYTRFEWTSMETDSGVYTLTGNWPSLEFNLKYAADRGQLFGFGGVMTAYDGEHGLYYDGAWSVYPQYLHNKMQAEVATPDWKYNGTNNWIPNWNSPSYLARWEALNDTIYKFIQNWSYTPSSGPWAGKLVTGKKILDWADIRGYGNFGEWHTYPWSESTPANAVLTDSSFKKIVDVTKNIFKDIPIHILIAVFDDNPWTESNAWRAYYVLTERNEWGLFGWRRDNIGDKGYDNFLINNTWTYGGWHADTAILDRWKYAMITGEPLNGSGSGNCCPIYYHIRPEIGTYHYMGFGNGNYGVRTSAAWDTIRADFKLTGFRFNLNGGSMNTTLYPDNPFFITLNWRNIGASPLYQKRWRVKYQLRTSGDVPVQTFTSKFNPFMFLPSNTDSEIKDTFTLGNSVPAGSTYKLVMYIEDTANLADPLFLPLSVPARNTDGSYTIRTGVAVSTSLPSVFQQTYVYNKTSYVQIYWKVNCLTSTSYYTVQKSTDGVNFTNYGSVGVDEMSCTTASYSMNDPFYSTGTSYYRVVRYDAANNPTYSPIMTVVMPASDNVVIYPKPTVGVFNVVVTNTFRGAVKMTISNLNGQVMRTYNYNKASDVLSVALNMTGFSPGIYIISTYQGGSLYNTQSQVKN